MDTAPSRPTPTPTSTSTSGGDRRSCTLSTGTQPAGVMEEGAEGAPEEAALAVEADVRVVRTKVLPPFLFGMKKLCAGLTSENWQQRWPPLQVVSVKPVQSPATCRQRLMQRSRNWAFDSPLLLMISATEGESNQTS